MTSNGAKEKSVLGSVAALAAPMILGQAGQVLLQLTDTLMLGQVGPVALAGAGLAGNLMMFALYFAYGSLGAVAPRVGQLFGAGDTTQTGTAIRAAGRLGFLIGSLLLLILCGAAGGLSWLGQPPEVVAITREYLVLLGFSLLPAMLSLALGQSLEAVNRPWPVFGFLLLAVVLNAGLNYILIFGHLGFPAMGLAGAGWATLIARCVQLAGLLLWVRRDPALRVFWTSPKSDADKRETGKLFRLGLPIAGQDVLEGGAFAAGTLMLGWIGTVALAANQVTIAIASLAWMFPIALSTATGVRVAQAIGAGDPKTARRAGLAGIGAGTALMAGCAVIYLSAGRSLAALFTSDPDVLALAGTLVTIAGIYQISDAVQSISLGALRGLLDNRIPLVANAICYWVLSLPTVWLLAFPLGWGATGVWVGYLPWMALTGLFFFVRFLRRTRPAG